MLQLLLLLGLAPCCCICCCCWINCCFCWLLCTSGTDGGGCDDDSDIVGGGCDDDSDTDGGVCDDTSDTDGGVCDDTSDTDGSVFDDNPHRVTDVKKTESIILRCSPTLEHPCPPTGAREPQLHRSSIFCPLSGLLPPPPLPCGRTVGTLLFRVCVSFCEVGSKYHH